MRLPDGAWGVACYFHELQAIRLAEEIISNAARRDALLLELNERLRTLSIPAAIMKATAEVVARGLRVTESGYVEVASDGPASLSGRAYVEGRPIPVAALRLGDFGDEFAAAMRAGEPFFSEDLTGHPQPLEEARAFQTKAIAAVPLMKQGSLVACLYAIHHLPRPWPEWERALLRELAERARCILERAHSQEELRQQTEQFEAFIQQAPMGIYMVDDEFRIRLVNRTASQIFGDTPELIGRDFDQVAHSLWTTEYADEQVKLLRDTLDSGKSHVFAERAERRFPRDVLEYDEWRIDRIALADRHGVVCYFRDVSRFVRAREARRRAERVLARVASADAFRVAFADALRSMTDPMDVMGEAVRVLGERLSLSRAFYAELDHCGPSLLGVAPRVPSARCRCPSAKAASRRLRGGAHRSAARGAHGGGRRRRCIAFNRPRAFGVRGHLARGLSSWCPSSEQESSSLWWVAIRPPRAGGPITKYRSSKKLPKGHGLRSSGLG